MDNLSYIHTWKHPEIIAKFPLLVLTRGERRFSNPDFKATIISFEHANISSTLVRDKLRQNESVLAFVPKTIEDYILKYQLYRE